MRAGTHTWSNAQAPTAAVIKAAQHVRVPGSATKGLWGWTGSVMCHIVVMTIKIGEGRRTGLSALHWRRKVRASCQIAVETIKWGQGQRAKVFKSGATKAAAASGLKPWRWRGGVKCQMAVVTTNKGRDDAQRTGGAEGGWHVRSHLRLITEDRDDCDIQQLQHWHRQSGGGEGGWHVRSQWPLRNEGRQNLLRKWQLQQHKSNQTSQCY